MVSFLSCLKTFLLLLATAFVAINGYHHNLVQGETSANGLRYNDDTSLNSKRDNEKNVMWIGPRLGRRKRSEEENNLAEKNTGAVLELLQDSPWAIVALKGNKRRTVNFIPRLGRDSEEDYVDAPPETGFGKSNSRSGSQVLGPFGGSNNFTPRLGRFAALFNKDHV